jgi:hypothetical protein
MESRLAAARNQSYQRCTIEICQAGAPAHKTHSVSTPPVCADKVSRHLPTPNVTSSQRTDAQPKCSTSFGLEEIYTTISLKNEPFGIHIPSFGWSGGFVIRANSLVTEVTLEVGRNGTEF